MKIAVSAGHYPQAPGACWDGVCEHQEALIWQILLASILKHRGYQVRKIKPGKLPQKVAEINEFGPDLALEIHFNACGGCNAQGSETLYYPYSAEGKKAAEIMQKNLCTAFKPNRGAKEGWYKMDRPGIKDYPGDSEGDEQPDYFLRKTACVALIVEPEFIHHYEKIREYCDKGCVLIANGIDDYLQPA